MPKAIIESMKRGGVRNPYALLNAAGYKEGDAEETVKHKLASFQRARKYLHGKKHSSKKSS